MPRPRKDGTPDRPAAPVQRPEGIEDIVWEMSGVLGNLALAQSLHDVATGRRAPRGAAETVVLLQASQKIAGRSTKRYVSLDERFGRQLDAARDQMRRDGERNVIMTRLLSDPHHAVNARLTSEDGHAGAEAQAEGDAVGNAAG